MLTILRRYEESGDRRFSDDVLDAEIEYGEAGAYLLGRDLRALCTSADETDAVHRFLTRVQHRDFHVPVHVLRTKDELDRPFMREVAAFARGFGG